MWMEDETTISLVMMFDKKIKFLRLVLPVGYKLKKPLLCEETIEMLASKLSERSSQLSHKQTIQAMVNQESRSSP